eukprot:Pgem_evm1s12027
MNVLQSRPNYSESGCDTHLLELQHLEGNFILKTLLELEKTYTVNSDYLNKVQENGIETWMRAHLVEWMLEVCDQYSLSCVSLAVNYVDRFLSKEKEDHEELQCVGAAALLIASKIKDVTPLNPNLLCVCSDHAFPVESLKKMEHKMLCSLSWKLNPVTADEVAEFILMRINFEEHSFSTIRKYTLLLIEMSFIDYKFVKYNQSIVAASALVNSLSLMKYA